MEHAITFDDPANYLADINSGLPIILSVWRDRLRSCVRERRRKSKPSDRPSSICSGWRIVRFAKSPSPERRGTLVFPDKSTVEKNTDFDRDAFARRLAALPDEFQPVAVSMPWRDVQRGAFVAFERAGLMLVTSGHVKDPLFLFRQYDLCRHFKYAAANDISTSFCMSVLGGCRFFFLHGGTLTITEHGVTTIYENEPTLHLPAKQACLEVSRFPPSEDRSAQLRLAEHYAGKAFVRAPEFFRAAADDGYRMLQAVPPPSWMPVSVPDRRPAWLTNGIDVDGWADRQASLRVPERAGTGACGCRSSFRGRKDGIPNCTLRPATIGEKCRFAVAHGRWRSRSRPAVRALTCISSWTTIFLAGDDRRRAYRVVRIEWLDRPGRLWFGRVRLWRDRKRWWRRFLP